MSCAFRGRLFGPSLPGSGVAASARWQNDDLLVRHDQGEVFLAALQIRSSGFNQQQLQLTGQGGEGFVLVVSERDEQVALRATAPVGLLPALRSVTNASTGSSRRWVAVWLTLASFVVTGTIGAWWLLSFASSQLAKWIPPEQEARLGEMILVQTRSRHELSDQGIVADAVRVIGTKLIVGSQLHYRWFVSDEPDLNAFAAPGGIVVVTTGLIKAAESPEQLAGVLAHEVAHAELRHGTRALIKSLGLRGILSLVFGGRSTQIAAQFTELKFTRDAEREADREGLRRMQNAGIAPSGMLQIFEKLDQQASTSRLTPPTFLSTHPDLKERIEWVKKVLRESPRAPTHRIEVDWTAVQAARAQSERLGRP